MIYDLKKYVDFLKKHDLTPNQFLFCMMIYRKEKDSIIEYQKFIKENYNRNAFVEEEIQDLIVKNLIIDINMMDKEKGIPLRKMNGFITGPAFDEDMVIDTDEAGEELWDKYPSFVYIHGQNKKAPTKACDKDALLAKYGAIIKNNKELHRKIIQDVEKMRKNNYGYAEMNISNYVGGRQWESGNDEQGGVADESIR